MATGDKDEQGVLGNLPRSRPGQRSAKRGGTTASASPATRARVAKAKAKSRAKAKPAASRPKPKPAAAPKRTVTTASERPPSAAQPQSSGDPVTSAVKAAAKVATIGPRVAIGITKRLLGR